MVTDAAVRDAARALAGAVEPDHHGFPSFRVAGRIFATLPRPDHLRAMLIRAAVAARPDACHAFRWGQRLACVEVDLTVADAALVDDVLTAAWAHQVALAGRPRRSGRR